MSDTEAYFKVVDMVLHSGIPNYQGMPIPLPSTFNWDFLKANTIDYHDKAFIDYIMYGFPLGLNRNHTITSNSLDNHSSAFHFPQAVSDFIAAELEAGALMGQFTAPPHHSYTWFPLMRHPKGKGRRIILNLSFGRDSVNNHTDTTCYNGRPFKLKLPNLDSIVPQFEALGADARLYKIDISRAFHNVPTDPGDTKHPGSKWNNQFFVDRNLAFGEVHGTAIFQRSSDVAHKDSTHEAFNTLRDILHDIGLPLNDKKVFAPCKILSIMGIVVDIEARTFSITDEKMLEMSHSCIEFFLRDRFTKRELQSLLGKLLYVSRCVAVSCRFLNRMLHSLRLNHKSRDIYPDTEFCMDLLWFIQFLQVFNGTVSFRRNPVQHHVYVDATLMGLGAVWGDKIYAAPIPMRRLFYYSF